MMRRITAEEVKALRNETGDGMMRCKEILQRKALIEAIYNLECSEELREILIYLADNSFLRDKTFDR